jgi:hypothetical protein
LLGAFFGLLRLSQVFHFHNKGVANSKSSIVKRIYPFVFKKTKVILLSPMLYQDIAAFVPAENIYSYTNGMNDLIGTRAIGNPLKIKPNEVVGI